jgi:beta-glucosidase
MAFPKEFIWGAATASFQIEGGAWEGGRGESNWDRFCRTPGCVKNGDTGDVACDHYHKYKEDVQLLKELGVGYYRYSIAWPRIFPEGSGKVNQEGIDFYRRLNDELLAAGIKPFPTMYHWDLPQVLEERGGWASREIVELFGEYANTIVSALSDQVKNWFTLNEPWCTAFYGYYHGRFAPGRKESPKVVAEVIHNLLLAHGLGVQAVRANGAPSAEVGIVLNTFNYLPETDSPADIAARDARWQKENGWWLDPIYTGSYPEGTWMDLEDARPEILSGDMEIISSPTDLIGLNIYSANIVGKDGSWDKKDDTEVTDFGWPVRPEGIYSGIERVANVYSPKKIFITENGACYDDVIGEDGLVSFLDRYLAQVERAADEGLPIKGYFVWSLLDNFEWADGYSRRFGIIFTDYENGCRRIPKDSYHFYNELIKRANS